MTKTRIYKDGESREVYPVDVREWCGEGWSTAPSNLPQTNTEPQILSTPENVSEPGLYELSGLDEILEPEILEPEILEPENIESPVIVTEKKSKKKK
jgi:hypothetical protein